MIPVASRPDDRDLRPRSAIELADAAVEACRRSFGALVAVSLAFTLPVTVVFWVALGIGSRVTVIGSGVLVGVGLLLAHAGGVDVVGELWLGGSPAIGGAVRRTVRRAPAVLWLWVVGGLRVVVGTVLLVVPGVIAAVGLVPAVPIMVLERTPAIAAVRRSSVLSRGRRGAMFGALLATLTLVVALLMILVQPIVAAAAVGTGRDAPALVAAAGAQVAVCVLVVPLFAAVSAAAYVDGRVRKEGLDLLYLLAPEGASA